MPSRNIDAPGADTHLSTREVEALVDPVIAKGPLVLAVSGGPDSVQLMHMFAARRGEVKLHVITVDHQLRPNSAREAAQVAEWAKALGLPHNVLVWEGSKPDSALQEAARAARYGLIANWCLANDFMNVVTGHNLDDQAETVLMRLARGSGPDGVAAMAPQTEIFGISLLRPLLDVPHDRLVASLRHTGVPYIEDPSNDDLSFERVRVRKARAARMQLDLDDAMLAETARRMGRAAAALNEISLSHLTQCARFFEYGCCEIDPSRFLEMPREIGLRTLTKILKVVGAREWPPGNKKLEALYSSILCDLPKPTTLAGCRISKRKEAILVSRELGRVNSNPLSLCATEPIIWDNRFALSVIGNVHNNFTVGPLGENGWAKLKHTNSVIPALVGQCLPAIWEGETIVAVPNLDFSAEKLTRGCRFFATFLNPFSA